MKRCFETLGVPLCLILAWMAGMVLFALPSGVLA